MGHLVLQRKVGERIAVGDDITIEICGIRGSRVSVAITAPKETSVHRMEVYKAIKAKESGNDQSAA